jgi:hypothetical protein
VLWLPCRRAADRISSANTAGSQSIQRGIPVWADGDAWPAADARVVYEACGTFAIASW